MNEPENATPDDAAPTNATAVDPPAVPLDLAASSLCCVIQFLPDDGDDSGRLASLAVKATQAARPTFHPALIRLKLSDLPPAVLALLERHRHSATLSPPVQAPTARSSAAPRLAAAVRKRKVDLNAAPAASPAALTQQTPVVAPLPDGNVDDAADRTADRTADHTADRMADGSADADPAVQNAAPTQFTLFDI